MVGEVYEEDKTESEIRFGSAGYGQVRSGAAWQRMVRQGTGWSGDVRFGVVRHYEVG